MTGTEVATRTTGKDVVVRNTATAMALPKPASDRWWRITHDPRRRKDPIKVELMESMTGNRRALSRVLGYDYTIASPKAVGECAAAIEARVADYMLVVGEYGGE